MKQNTKFRGPKLGYLKNKQEYTDNIPEYANKKKLDLFPWGV